MNLVPCRDAAEELEDAAGSSVASQKGKIGADQQYLEKVRRRGGPGGAFDPPMHIG